MAEKKITRKVISPSKTVRPLDEKVAFKAAPKEAPEKVEQEEGDSKQTTGRTGSAYGAKKVCPFCQSKTDPVYTDTQALRRFTTDRAKIVPRAKSSLCSRHQRILTRHIKYARHLALLPFVPQV